VLPLLLQRRNIPRVKAQFPGFEEVETLATHSWKSLAGTFALKDFRDLLMQNRYLVGHCILYHTVLYPEIPMNQTISHSCHDSPFNMTIFLLKAIGNLFCSFANNFKASHKSPF
jgi:hypothetical protein